MDIRKVQVELLRAGSKHGHLLNPLTRYLGICDEHQAGIVSIPFEHAALESLFLNDLNYRVISEDAGRRAQVMEQIGAEIAQVLGSIPGVEGSLKGRRDGEAALVNLRIVLSAAELAMLPFEVSKSPTSGSGYPDGWLALRSQSPVCITRHIRAVSATSRQWPTNPRILYVAGPSVPCEEHLALLRAVISPWMLELGDEAKRQVNQEKLLVCLTGERATISGIMETTRLASEQGHPFTHVHILAHGESLNTGSPHPAPVGVLLADEVVSGARLAGSLCARRDEGVDQPVAVTLASCLSGDVGDIRTPGASVAHDLHEAGIPLVVASQFMLSMEGSLPFVRLFYDGQLWGEHPIATLYDIRRHLHSQEEEEIHDWASLVAYEALPEDFAEHLEDLHYWQTRRAQSCALERLEALPFDSEVSFDEILYRERVDAVDAASRRLPISGPYAMECAGLRAAAAKRIAEKAILIAVGIDSPSEEIVARLLGSCLERFEEARTVYRSAAHAMLGSGADPEIRKANLHWLLGQVLSVDTFLGRGVDADFWSAARLAASVDSRSSDASIRCWAEVSLAELHLLRLDDAQLSDAARSEFAQQAIESARNMVEILGRSSEQARTTSRQIGRYVGIWGNSDLGWALTALGVPERPHWHEPHGVVPTAKALLKVLGADLRRHVPSRNGGAKDPAKECAAKQKSTKKKSAKKAARRKSSDEKKGTTSRRKPDRRSKAGSKDGRPKRKRALFELEMLPAKNGDCLWIEYGDPDRPSRILIDCGDRSAAKSLEERIIGLGPKRDRRFELFVLTHIDGDHINGVLPFFQSQKHGAQFDDIWFNGWNQLRGFLSIKQGEAFSDILEHQERPWNRAVTVEEASAPAPIVVDEKGAPPCFELPGGMEVTVLSPGSRQLESLARKWLLALADLKPKKAMLGRRPIPPVDDFRTWDLEELAERPQRKDASVANGSSIALLLEFEGRSALMTGDAHAEVLVSAIERLQKHRGREGERLVVDALKLSHHGSANGTTNRLLEVIDCPRYLVSTNGRIFYHPDREAIARVVVNGGERPVLLFNYRSEVNELWDNETLKKRYGFEARFGEEGRRVALLR